MKLTTKNCVLSILGTMFCLMGLLLGVFLDMKETSPSGFSKHQTLSAATVPVSQVSMLPLDLQLDLGKKTQLTDDTVKHDTVYVPQPEVLVINKTRQKVDRPKGVTDVAWVMLTPEHTSKSSVKKSKIADREEQPAEPDVRSPEVPTIQLIVDGQTVYSKDDNHSTGGSQ
jgi:hypothetical protein